MSAALVLAALLALTVGTLGVAAGPSAVAGWVRTTLHLSDRVPKDVPPGSVVDLPGGGRLLVSTGEGTWIVGQGAPRRVGGPADEVAWSAFGNYLVRARGGRLQALSISGRIAWTQHYRGIVTAPIWSPDGYRIAFRLAGTVYVTAGDGTGAHALRPAGSQRALRSLAAPPSWRPGAGHRLTVLDRHRRITLIDADSGDVLWRVRAPEATRSLSWSRNGRRLLAVGARTQSLFGPGGRLLARARAPVGVRIVAGELSPDGDQIALIRQRPSADGGSRRDAVLVPAEDPVARPRELLAGHDLADLHYSPDGRWLLVGWRRIDSWLFFATARDNPQTRLVQAVSRRLGHGKPVVDGWCCSRRRHRG